MKGGSGKIANNSRKNRTTANRNGKNQQLKKGVCWIEEKQTFSRHTEQGPQSMGRGCGNWEFRIFSRTGGFIFSDSSSFPNLALLILKKVGMSDWLNCHQHVLTRPWTWWPLHPEAYWWEGIKAHEALVLSCQHCVLGPQGEEEVSRFGSHHLPYLVIALLTVCLPFTDADP